VRPGYNVRRVARRTHGAGGHEEAAVTPRSAPTLLCAGESFDDLIFVALKRLPGPGEEIKTDHFVATVGGGVVITAVAAARLGLHVRAMSACGPAVARRLRAEGIVVRNLRRRGEPHAITAALSTTHERSFATFIGVNAKLESRLLQALSRVRATHLHLALCPRNCTRWARAITSLRARGITTSADFGWNEGLAGTRGFIPLLDALDFVFLNDLEATHYAKEKTLRRALTFWRARKSIAILKEGAKGSRWITPEGDIHVRARRVKVVVDTTGAGDAFNGGFLWAWLNGELPTRCLAAGGAVGAASVRKPGGLDGLPKSIAMPRAIKVPRVPGAKGAKGG
jgi:sugar/nucleoside kinase (ribokinase family)